MSTFKLSFPKAYDYFCKSSKSTHPIWNAEFIGFDNSSDESTLKILELREISNILSSNFDNWLQWIYMINEDLNNMVINTSNDLIIDRIYAYKLLITIDIIEFSWKSGRKIETFHLLHIAISHSHNPRKIKQEDIFCFYGFKSIPENDLCLEKRYTFTLPKYITILFHTAYNQGGYDTLTEQAFEISLIVISFIQQYNPNDEDCIASLAHICIWATTKKDNEKAKKVVAILLSCFNNPETNQYNKVTILLTLISDAYQYTDKSQYEWCKIILNQFNDKLRGHQKLQTLSIYITKDQPTFNNYKEQVIKEIISFREKIIKSISSNEKFNDVLEFYIKNIYPILTAIMEYGTTRDFLSTLTAWYYGTQNNDLDENILIIVPVYFGKAAYLWPQGRFLPECKDNDGTTHNQMWRNFSAATGTYFRGTDGDYESDIEEHRFYIPNFENGKALLSSMQKHYKLEELSPELPQSWAPQSIIVFPNPPEPIQALLSKEINISAPLQVSFQNPLPMRKIKTISIWAPNTVINQNDELTAIKYMAEQVTWKIKIFQNNQATIEEFKKFYEDNEADILWIISHSEFDYYQEDKTWLNISETSKLSLAELKTWKIESNQRRLLVLNSCSSATSQGRNGRATQGLASTLVCPQQAVIGHLWPIHHLAALRFGAAFVDQLANNNDINNALAVARTKIYDNSYFENKYSECSNIIDRINNSTENMDNILHWGCPVLYT